MCTVVVSFEIIPEPQSRSDFKWVVDFYGYSRSPTCPTGCVLHFLQPQQICFVMGSICSSTYHRAPGLKSAKSLPSFEGMGVN